MDEDKIDNYVSDKTCGFLEEDLYLFSNYINIIKFGNFVAADTFFT